MCLDLFKKRVPPELSGVERPSPSDIVPKANIKIDGTKVTIDYRTLNIPFTKPPILLRIMDIPDTNSMDGYFDYGHNLLYIKPVDSDNHKIMVAWLADEFIKSGGLLANDCAYRIMVDENDDPYDGFKPYLFAAIHRIIGVEEDEKGRFFSFKGINNTRKDPYKVRDYNILWLNTGVIY